MLYCIAMEKKTNKTTAMVKAERRRQKLEDLAFAAFQMERGEYPYPKGVPRGPKKPDGTYDWNKKELARLYGWKNSGNYLQLFDDPVFKQALEYHRWRASDPQFRKRVKNQVGTLTLELAFDAIYEKLMFHSEDLKLKDYLNVIKTYVDAGIKMQPKKVNDKTQELLGAVSEEEREVLIEEQRKYLEQQMERLDSIDSATSVDIEAEDVEDIEEG